MNIYLISQAHNNEYNTFDSAVVIARTVDDARKMNPADYPPYMTLWGDADRKKSWCDPEYVKVELIGTALPGATPKVVESSYNPA